MSAREPQVRAAATEVESAHRHVAGVVLFGSRARGDAQPGDDWDLALVTRGTAGEALEALAHTDGADVRAFGAAHLARWSTRCDGIEASVLRQGQVIAGRWEKPLCRSRGLDFSWHTIEDYLVTLDRTMAALAQGQCAAERACAKLAEIAVLVEGMYPKRRDSSEAITTQVEKEGRTKILGGGHRQYALPHPTRQRLRTTLVKLRQARGAQSTESAYETLGEAEAEWLTRHTRKTQTVRAVVMHHLERMEGAPNIGVPPMDEAIEKRREAAANVIRTMCADRTAMPEPAWEGCAAWEHRLDGLERAAATYAGNGARDEATVRTLARASARYDIARAAARPQASARWPALAALAPRLESGPEERIARRLRASERTR